MIAALVALTTAGVSAATPTHTVYIMENNTTIGTYTIGSGTVSATTVVSPPAAATIQNLAELPNGILYFIDANGELWSFNPATPATAPIDVGSTGLGTSPARLAADSRGYLVTTNAATSEIEYINPTVSAMPIAADTVALTGAPTTATAGGDIAVAQNGQLYEVTAEQIFEFSPLGGAVTTLNGADGASADITSLAFDPVNGNLYGGVTGGPPSNVYLFNQTTGVGTLADTITNGGTINDFASLPTYPDLSVTKTHTGNFDIGSTNTYTITVTNNGQFPTGGNTITVQDTLPTGLTFNAAGTSGTGWTCALKSGSTSIVLCTTTNTIAAGGTSTITLGVNVVGPAGNVNNVVQVTGGGQPVVLPTSIFTNPTTISNDAVLDVVKTGPATINQGASITYSIVVSDAATATAGANGTILSDTVPTNITGVAVTCGTPTGGAACPTGAITVSGANAFSSTIPTLPAGGSVTYTVTGTATTTGSITNTATVAGATGVVVGPQSTLTSSVATTIDAAAKLVVTKTASSASVAQGATESYSIVVTNDGPGAANATTVSDPVPSNYTGVTATCGAATGGAVCPTAANITVTGNTVTTNVPTLPSGGSVTFTVDGTAATTGTGIANTVTIAPPTGVNAATGSTLTATATTAVTAGAKLVVTKTASAASVAQGGTETYTVVVTNDGPSAANGTTLSDPVPANYTGLAATCGTATGGAACPTTANITFTGNTLSTNVPTLPSGGSVTFTITGTASTTGTGIVNTATIAPPTGVSAASGSTLTASATTAVSPVASLTIAKTGPATAALDGLIAYQILVSNAGPSTASGASFSDPIPANLTIEGTPSCAVTTGAATCGTVTVTGQNVTSVITALPSGAAVTFSINVKPTVTGTYTNTATIAPPAGTTSNKPATSSATTVVSATTNGFTKTVQNITAGTAAGTSDTGKPGDTLQYVLTFTNTTGTAISNFVVTDPTPTSTTFLSAACGALPAGVTACTIAKPAVGATGTVTYTLTGSLASGGVVTFTLNVKIT